VEALRLALIESFQGNSGTWHLSFHFVAELTAKPDLTLGSAVAEARWFPLGDLPPREDVAHHGRALHTMRAIARGSDSAEE
jgi:hypothetical protein